MAPIATLADLIAQLRAAFDGDKVDVDYVKELMLSYKSNRLEWEKYAKFDHYRSATSFNQSDMFAPQPCHPNFLSFSKSRCNC